MIYYNEKVYENIPEVVKSSDGKTVVVNAVKSSLAALTARGIDIREATGEEVAAFDAEIAAHESEIAAQQAAAFEQEVKITAAMDEYIAAIQAAYATAGVEFALDADGLPPGAGEMQAALGEKLSAADFQAHTLQILAAFVNYEAIKNSAYEEFKRGDS